MALIRNATLSRRVPYNVFFPAALAFAHLALAAAASLARVAGLLRLSFFLAAFDLGLPLILAQRALAAAAIAAVPAADILRLFGVLGVNGKGTHFHHRLQSNRSCAVAFRSVP